MSFIITTEEATKELKDQFDKFLICIKNKYEVKVFRDFIKNNFNTLLDEFIKGHLIEKTVDERLKELEDKVKSLEATKADKYYLETWQGHQSKAWQSNSPIESVIGKQQ